jgi:hypothetical protein
MREKKGGLCRMKGATLVSQMRNRMSSSSRSCLLARSILLEADLVYINLVSYNVEKKIFIFNLRFDELNVGQ